MSRPLPLACAGDDLDALYDARDRAIADREAAATAMRNADAADDWPTHELACAAFDAADEALAAIEARIEEIEEDDAMAALAEARTGYWQRVI